MFNFRIIDMPDGNQVIDPSLKTPYNALTAVEMLEYPGDTQREHDHQVILSV